MRNRFSPGCTVWVCSPETVFVGIAVGTAVGAFVGTAVGTVVGTGVEVKATIGVVPAAVVDVGVTALGLGVVVTVETTPEVGVGETTGTTVRPDGVVTVAVGSSCTSETTAGLARLQPAIRATRSRAKAITTSVFFFMVASL